MARRSKRPDGRYERKVTLASGKRISVYAETAALADQEVEKMRKKIAQGINPLSERVPLGEYLQYWMDTIITPRRKPKTVRNYTQMLAHIPERMKSMSLADLKPEVLRAFVQQLESQPLAAATRPAVSSTRRS